MRNEFEAGLTQSFSDGKDGEESLPRVGIRYPRLDFFVGGLLDLRDRRVVPETSSAERGAFIQDTAEPMLMTQSEEITPME